MQRVVREPDAEVAVESRAQGGLNFRAIPVRLPWKRILIPQGLDQNHLALEAPALSRTSGGGRELGSNQFRTLRVHRLAVRTAELVPHIQVRCGHLTRW